MIDRILDTVRTAFADWLHRQALDEPRPRPRPPRMPEQGTRTDRKPNG